MLARRLTTILPALPLAEAIETTRIHSVAGRTDGRPAWVPTRPVGRRTPHSPLWNLAQVRRVCSSPIRARSPLT